MLRLIFLALAILCHNVLADSPAVISELEKIQNESATKTASIGFCMVPLDGEPSDATGYHIDTGLIPASTMKAITTATAVEILGPDFMFRTELQLAGILGDDGTLSGDVVVRGGGDPTLAESGISATFERWKEALTEEGVKMIDGSVVGDASLFGTRRVPDSWQWNDFGNYYGAGACGLTFHQNQFFCRFDPGSVGAEARFIGTDPKLPGVEFLNEMKTGTSSSGDQGYIYGAPYGKVFYLRGSVPAGGTFTIKGALPDPAMFCAQAFTEYLNENGLEVSGDPTTERLLRIAGKSLAARKNIHEIESAPLEEILLLTNLKSNNLRAECIHRMIGVERGSEGSIDAACDAVAAYWEKKEIDMTGFHMADGSGLSRANTVTARQMALILYHAAKGENFESFRQSLPVAGQSGTLRNIGRGSAVDGRIRAKSGTIGRVKCYAGYADPRSDKRYAFAIFINNYVGSSSTVNSQIVRVWSKMMSL